MSDDKNAVLKQLPPMTELLKHSIVAGWLKKHPTVQVTNALREAVAKTRERILAGHRDSENRPSLDEIVTRAEVLLERVTQPNIRHAINATGVILHTGLGRAVFPSAVVDSLERELRGYCTLATSRDTGERAERDELLEPLLTQLTGAEAATVVNNNAAATLLVLAAVAAGKQVLVSRGQLIEIGGSFRLPEVMAQSGAVLAEVGATNRTHLKDYRNGINELTGAIMRVHPSNYRIVGFTSQPSLPELSALAREHSLVLIDDLGAGSLVGLEQFGLPHEPTVRESLEAGADLVLFSGDKLIGGAQSGIIVGRKDLVGRIRKHPLMRAMRIDKTCAMVLERTLQLFLDPGRLRELHPLYRALSTPPALLRNRAERLAASLQRLDLRAAVEESQSFLGSGSLPTEAIASFMVTVSSRMASAEDIARRLRIDSRCVFSRIEKDRVCLDMRTVSDEELPAIAEAVARAVSGAG